jgi:hypothetical protein
MGAGTLTTVPPTEPPTLIDIKTATRLEMLVRLHQRGRRAQLAPEIAEDNLLQFPLAGYICYTHVVRRSRSVFFGPTSLPTRIYRSRSQRALDQAKATAVSRVLPLAV